MGCICSKGISANEYVEKESKRSSKQFLGSSRREDGALEVNSGVVNDATTRLISDIENAPSFGQTFWDEAGERKSVVVYEQPLVQSSQNYVKIETDRNGVTHLPEISRVFSIANGVDGAQKVAGWPSWLTAVAGEAVKGWLARTADSFEKLDKDWTWDLQQCVQSS